MANVKISQLPSATSVSNSTTLAVVQSGTTYQATLAQVGAAIGGGGSTGNFTFSGNTITLPYAQEGIINTSGVGNIMVTTTYQSSSWYFNNAQMNPSYYNNGAGEVPAITYNSYANNQSTLQWAAFLQSIPSGSPISYFDGGRTETGIVTGFAQTIDPNNPGGTINSLLFDLESGTINQGYALQYFTVTMPTQGNVSGQYIFSNSGTFISSTALVGNLYVSNNIITPLPTTSTNGYNTQVPQPVVINGDLYVSNVVAQSLSSTEIKVNSTGEIQIGIQNTGYLGYGNNVIAIGTYAAPNGSFDDIIAIGRLSGGYGQVPANAISIGAGTGSGPGAIAIGQSAAENDAASWSVAIGGFAGVNGTSIQNAQSIVINATGGNLGDSGTNTFTVKPVRHVINGSLPSGFYNMAYNPTTGEIIYWS